MSVEMGIDMYRKLWDQGIGGREVSAFSRRDDGRFRRFSKE
jgi:hypothetical protein